MKYVLVYLFSIATLNAVSQKPAIICGKVRSPGKFIIHFYEPINGYPNYSFFDSTATNSSLVDGVDSIYKIINVERPSFVSIYFTDEENKFITRGDVLITPGDSLHILCDLNQDDSNSIIYSGSNAMGQKLFNEIDFQPFNKYIPVFDALDRFRRCW